MSTSTPGRLTVSDLRSMHLTLTSTTGESVEVDMALPVPERARPAFRVSSEAKVTTKPADESSKRVKFMRRLVAERYPSASEEYVLSVVAQGPARVSQAITKLLALPKVAQAPRVNRYAGTCEHCGDRVAVDAGVLTVSDEGKWEVAHRDGECPESGFPFPVGRYAVHLDGVLHFFHARTDGLFEQASDALYLVSGPRRSDVVTLVAADPQEASYTYGRNLGSCGRCGRTLTDEVSRAAGIGPVCQTKAW